MANLINDANETAWSEIPYALDKGIGWFAHIGLVIISNDQTLPYEAREILRIPGIALYESRLTTARKPNEPVSEKNLLDQASKIESAVEQINAMRFPDVVALGCTSAAMLIGQDKLAKKIGNGQATKITDPFTAIKAALKALDSRKIVYISPYPRALAERMVSEIKNNDIQVLAARTFQNNSGEIGDEAPFITLSSIKDAVLSASVLDGIDTIVIACTQMRAAEVIDELEKITGKNIVTSNQALCWHALRLTGYSGEITGWGELLKCSI